MSENGAAKPPAEEGTQMSDGWLERYRAHMMGTVTGPMALLVRGEGSYVWDASGKRYLDFLAGIAVNSLGHGRSPGNRRFRSRLRLCFPE